jgi:hypothetical protein
MKSTGLYITVQYSIFTVYLHMHFYGESSLEIEQILKGRRMKEE